MPARPETKPRRLPYWISFTAFTLFLGGLTVAFVLGVLRQRFVLHAGLRESGVSFPTGPTPFTVQERAMVRPSLAILLPPDVESEARPGPSEAFWDSVLPLLREERYRESLAIFAEYLRRFPAGQAVRREYAVALARAGRLADSEAAFLQVVAATDDAAVRLELARLQRDRRAFGRSVATYRQLLVERPEDPRLRRELARTLAWAERYEEAIAEYDALLTLEPERPDFLLEYARVLFWAQRLEAAQRVLAELPEDSPDLDAAGTLTAQIAALLAVPEPGAAPEIELGVLERARKAAAEGALPLADRLYAQAVDESPEDPALLLEWADLLQFRLMDLEWARVVLLRRAELVTLDAAERFRLARLAAWTDREEEALDRLTLLLADEPEMAEAWLLLGEVRRWRGDRPAAASAYDRVLALDPDDERAEAGLRAVRERSQVVMDEREKPGAGPVLTLFDDSDGYRQLDLLASAALQPNENGLHVRAGYRRLEGPEISEEPDGGEGLDPESRELGSEEGPFAQVEYVRWWRGATLRTAVWVGLEDVGAIAAQPSFGARLEAPDLSGPDVRAEYRHGPAYPITRTFGSARAELVSDGLTLTAYRPLGAEWVLWAAADATSIRGAGTDNWRLNAQLQATRRISEIFSVGIATSVLGYTERAPDGTSGSLGTSGSPGARGSPGTLYWDPRLFWATGLVLDVRTANREGLGAFARVLPGVALVDERSPDTDEFVPQLGLEGGLTYRLGRTSLFLNLSYARGREGGYSSFGLDLGASIRP